MKPISNYEDEKTLIAEFRTGRNAALQYIYDIHYHSIWSYARGLTKDDGQAEDIVMGAFLKAWERREGFKDLKGLMNFLFIVTRNASLNFIRERNKRKEVDLETGYLSDKTSQEMETELVRAELCQLAFLEAEQFPKQMKRAFMLIFREGLSLSEVADQMGVSVNTVKTHRAFALKSLRLILAKHSFTLFNFFFF